MEHLPPPDSTPNRRLLVPIAPWEESRWCIRHALSRAAAGEAIEVFLVYIVPPVARGDLLRFRAEQQDAERLLKRADIFLEEAAVHLLVAGIPCRKFVREADLVQGIRDFAEEWTCCEVILPNVYRNDVFSGAQRRKLKQLEQCLRVTWVKSDGSPELQLDDGWI